MGVQAADRGPTGRERTGVGAAGPVPQKPTAEPACGGTCSVMETHGSGLPQARLGKSAVAAG